MLFGKLNFSAIFVLVENSYIMKKIIIALSVIASASFVISSTSCEERVCIKCYKIGDSTDVKEICTVDAIKRNDFVVEQTHLDYNCSAVEE